MKAAGARSRSAGAGGVLAGVAVCAFAGAVLFATRAGRAPSWLWGFYLAASTLTFMVYARDKSAARRGARRTPERTLHAMALAGGWPGALVAQRALRHKTAKAPFLAVCWMTVLLHVAGFVAFLRLD